jgi:hypothetical protein
MHPQLETIVAQFDEATKRLDQLVSTTPSDAWFRRIDPDRWSVGECIEHLNLTARAYLPIIDSGIVEARHIGGAVPSKYRRDLIGWLLWKSMGPPVRHRVRTTAAFIPASANTPDALVAEFKRLQQEQVQRVQACDGLPLQRVRVQSPFNAKVRYNLFSCLTILPPHQHRHIWQAEQLLKQ